MRLWIVLFLLSATGAALATEPSASLPTGSDRQKKEILALLRANRQKYGDDAAIMQGLLLVHANMGGAILATEATIVGFEEIDALRWISFHVDSGAIFDDETTSRVDRVERIWKTIVERTLRRYPTFSVPGDGIAVEVLWRHRPRASMANLHRGIDEEGTIEKAKFFLRGGDLTEFIARRLEPQGLLERSKVLLDDEPVTVELHELVGPPLPEASAGAP